jgi:prolyl-tRNA synthetase
LINKIRDLAAALKSHGVRIYVDDRENYNPGWKYNNWEMKGVPLRIELGKKDFQSEEVRVVRRDDSSKQQVKWDVLHNYIPSLLEQIHEDMYNRALKTRDDHISKVDNWADFMTELNKRNLCLAPWCNDQECEKAAKERSK